MGILNTFFQNTRKPEGLLGKWMLSSMNHAHAAVADWGISHLPCLHNPSIVDLGCGGGRNVKELLCRYAGSNVTALDYSEISIEKTKQVNKKEIQNGRCRVMQGDVSHLPFEDCEFDLATAFETVYFWPGPTASFREVYRILKPGGVFLIVNESDGTKSSDEKWLSTIDGLSIYGKTQLYSLLSEAGFSQVTHVSEDNKHWLCVLAVRGK